MTKKIAIIAGAGPAGLTAAYELLDRTDIKPIIFEATKATGGIAQTYNYKGNRIDIGGHRFFSKSERVMNWWFNILPLQGAPAIDTLEKKHEIDYATEVIISYLCPECQTSTINQNSQKNQQKTKKQKSKKGKKSKKEITYKAPDPEKQDKVMLQRPRLSRIFYKRNFFPYPIGISIMVAFRLGLWNTFMIGLSYIKAHLFPIKEETYLDAFFINRFGKRLYKTFFKDYTEKVWGVKCSEIRADWGAQRVKGLSLKRAVQHAIKDLISSDFRKAQEARETSLITRFFYPKYGPGQMWETVCEQIINCKGEVHFNHVVKAVKCNQNNQIQSVIVKDLENNVEKEFFCDYFFSTMPIKELINSISPKPPEEVITVANGLEYRDFITVGLLLKKMHIQQNSKPPLKTIPDNWIYIQEGDVKVGRVQVFNNWSPYLVADKNTVWIGLEYFVNEQDSLWHMPDPDLINLGIKEMEQIGFINSIDIVDGCVLRMPKAYPAYFGTYNQLNVIQDYTNTIENLFLIGRNGMHQYNNQDHSMMTAMMAVDNILEGCKDKTNLWEVNLEMVYHEDVEAK